MELSGFTPTMNLAGKWLDSAFLHDVRLFLSSGPRRCLVPIFEDSVR
jgi:hypothetical protein